MPRVEILSSWISFGDSEISGAGWLAMGLGVIATLSRTAEEGGPSPHGSAQSAARGQAPGLVGESNAAFQRVAIILREGR